ncbi:uncharacterized protein TNCV_223531 [Trichonephila clavipes]|nr:uncharacterized protein TNCV_223531 [Trichonephila clavipes]
MHRHTGPAPGIMVWDGIGYHSRSPLVHIDCTLNSQRYIPEVLKPVVLPCGSGDLQQWRLLWLEPHFTELEAAVAEWYRHRIVAGFVTSSSPVPLKSRRVGQRCTLNLSRAEMSSRWCGVVVRRGGASSGVVNVT